MAHKPPIFDPRSVPVIGRDSHLPPVAVSRLTAHALQSRFAGRVDWEPEVRSEPPMVTTAPRPAAVLIALVQRQELMVVLTQRPSHMRNHAGQIAFPGGKVDAGDASPIHAALREAEEEIGLSAAHVQVLGPMPVYRTGTGFDVTPVVGLVANAPSQWQAQAGEVESVFEIPLSFLMNPANHQLHIVEWQGVERHWWSMPWHDGATERFVWGATAGMLRNLYRFLVADAV